MMIHQIVGWLGLVVLTALAFRVTANVVHSTNLKADRNGKQARRRLLVLSGAYLLGANLALGLMVQFFLPAFTMHAVGWTLLAQAIGVPLGLLLAWRKTIRFYRRKEDRGEWSNFAEYPIVESEVTWATSENRFQADKFIGTDEGHRNAIRLAKTGQEAANLGRDRSHKMRSDWNEPANVEYTGDNRNLKEDWQRFCSTEMLVKDYSMLEAVRLKVRQHKYLRLSLLATGDSLFIEHTDKDNYWADGGDGSGRNMLGKIIMIVRLEESRPKVA